MIRTFRLLKIIWWYKISKMCQTFFCWNAICRLLHFWNSDSKIVSDVHPMSEGWRVIQSCQICDVVVVVVVVVADVVVQAEQAITKNACERTRRFQPLEKYWKWKKKKYIEQKSYLLCRSGVINPWLLTCGYQSVVTNLGLSTWGEGTQEVGWGGHVSRFYKFWKLCVLWKQVNLF